MTRDAPEKIQLDDGELLGRLCAGPAGDLAIFDAAAADFLPPCDVYTAQEVRAEAGEVAAFGVRCPL